MCTMIVDKEELNACDIYNLFLFYPLRVFCFHVDHPYKFQYCFFAISLFNLFRLVRNAALVDLWL